MTLIKLNNNIIKCRQCERLVNFREKIATEKRRQYINEAYWGKPITGYGDINSQLLMIGLAPAAHGGNRTGRVFTGDKSADFLFKCLFKAGFANQSISVSKDDGSTWYVCLVSIPSDGITSMSRELQLLPGMQATVNIVSGSKTILKYLLQPVTNIKNKAFRER